MGGHEFDARAACRRSARLPRERAQGAGKDSCRKTSKIGSRACSTARLEFGVARRDGVEQHLFARDGPVEEVELEDVDS